jgi:transposase
MLSFHTYLSEKYLFLLFAFSLLCNRLSDGDALSILMDEIKTSTNRCNGPENQSHRTQFMKRMVDFAQEYHLHVRLAYYPPYHSKYNPVERCWGALEGHWNGSLLDSIDAVIQYARSMTWKGAHPLVELVTTVYQTGAKLTKQAMDALETQFERLPHLDKWFVDIRDPSSSPG